MALKSVVLNPGDCVILPADAVIDSVIINGSATATSTCGTLPAPTTYKCGYFFFILDSDDNDGHSMDEDSTMYTSVTVGDNTYMINEKVIGLGDNPGIPNPVSLLNLHITDTVLFEFMAITVNDGADKRQHIHLYFQTPEPLFSSVRLKMANRGVSFHYYEPIESECGVYETPA